MSFMSCPKCKVDLIKLCSRKDSPYKCPRCQTRAIKSSVLKANSHPIFYKALLYTHDLAPMSEEQCPRCKKTCKSLASQSEGKDELIFCEPCDLFYISQGVYQQIPEHPLKDSNVKPRQTMFDYLASK